VSADSWDPQIPELPETLIQALADLWTEILLADLKENPSDCWPS